MSTFLEQCSKYPLLGFVYSINFFSPKFGRALMTGRLVNEPSSFTFSTLFISYGWFFFQIA